MRYTSACLLAGTISQSLLWLAIASFSTPAFPQRDPGADRGGPRNGGDGSPSTGDALRHLTSGELAAFNAGKLTFQEVDSVSGTLTEGSGLGPRFNMGGCSGCHAFPAIGGSSPAVNPQIAVATKAGARNIIPSFLSLN